MPELIKSTPRLKAVPMGSNPDLMIGVGEKGGVSIYGLQRFPVTLFQDQWLQLLDEEVIAELVGFIETNKAILSSGREAVAKGKPDEGYTVNAGDVAIVAAEAERLTAAGDVKGAIKYNTIKAVAELNKFKVSPEHMLEIMTLKARK